MKSLQNTDTFQRQARPFELKHTSLSLSRPFALGKSVNILQMNVSADEERKARYKNRDGLRKYTKLKGLKACGKTPIGPLVGAHINSDGRASFSSVATCSSVWSCPCCSLRISAGRADELSKLVEYAKRENLYVSLLTLTIRHHAGHSLRELWRAMSGAIGRTSSGARWVSFRDEQLRVVGTVRGIEATYSDVFGWNLHTHWLFLTRENPQVKPIIFQRKQGRAKKPFAPEVMSASDFIWERYLKGLQKYGLSALRDYGGMDWTVATGDAEEMARYISKAASMQVKEENLPAEVSLGMYKKTRREGNRTPFDIASDLVETGSEEDAKIWREWELTSRGKKALLWSKGLKELAGVDEVEDSELAKEQDENAGEAVILFNKANWYKLQPKSYMLLDSLEQGGINTAMAFCERLGIEYVLPDDLGPPKRE